MGRWRLRELILISSLCCSTSASAIGQHEEDETCARWTNEGMEAMQNGDVSAAVALFAEGARRHSSDSSMWMNTAVAQASLLGARQVTPGEQIKLYCEARAAAHLALRAGSDVAAELLQSIESEFAASVQQVAAEANTELRCPYGDMLPELRRIVDARRTEGENLNLYLQAVRTGCDAKSLVVQLRDSNHGQGVADSKISASDLLAISSLLDACGVVAITNAHSQTTIDRAREAQMNHYSRINRTELEQHGARKSATSGRSSEFSDMALRGDRRRVEATLPLIPTFNEIIAAPAMLSIVESVMHDRDIEVDTHSYVHAEPGSPQQPWHRDVDFLYGAEAEATGSQTLAHHTTHGVVAVVPLVDLEASNGATEFILGSHVHPSVLGQGLDLWDGELGTAHWEGKPLLSHTKILVPRGSVVLFDLRITHRGGPNHSESPRSVLYTSYVREWFRDAVNFKSLQSAWWDGLRSERLQKLFARVDGRDYTQHLERLLKEKGIDVNTDLLWQRDTIQ